jgi:hypothetical protein
VGPEPEDIAGCGCRERHDTCGGRGPLELLELRVLQKRERERETASTRPDERSHEYQPTDETALLPP